jgi:hypothetical protein
MHATCGVLVGHPGSRGLGRLGPQSTNMHTVDLMCTFEAFVHQVARCDTNLQLLKSFRLGLDGKCTSELGASVHEPAYAAVPMYEA